MLISVEGPFLTASVSSGKEVVQLAHMHTHTDSYTQVPDSSTTQKGFKGLNSTMSTYVPFSTYDFLLRLSLIVPNRMIIAGLSLQIPPRSDVLLQGNQYFMHHNAFFFSVEPLPAFTTLFF